MNTIRPDIRARLTAIDPRSKTADQKRAVQRIIKERVLQYSWRLFYEQVFVPSVKTSAPAIQLRYAWENLKSACRTYVREKGRFTERDEERLNFLLQRTRLSYDRAGKDAFPDPSEFPRDLVLYLAQEPYWALDTGQDTAAKDLAAKDLAAMIPKRVLKTPDNDFMELYEAHRIALARDDPDVNEAMRTRRRGCATGRGEFCCHPGPSRRPAWQPRLRRRALPLYRACQLAVRHRPGGLSRCPRLI